VRSATGAQRARRVARFTDGMFRSAGRTKALAAWERKNDIFGSGFLARETLANSAAPAAELHLDTFKRILAERVADAAGIVETGSTARAKNPPAYRDARGCAAPGAEHRQAAAMASTGLRDRPGTGRPVARGQWLDADVAFRVADTPVLVGRPAAAWR